MKIGITGAAGSLHESVAKEISNRLGLNFVSAKEMAIECCVKAGFEYKDFVKSKNVKLAETINMAISNKLEECDDYVCDAACLPYLCKGAVLIYLDRELVEEKVFPATLYEESLVKKAMFRNLTSPNPFVLSNYNIVINRTGLSNSYVVQFIIDQLQKGDTGFFLPARLCLPLDAFPLGCDIESDIDTFSIGKYFASYILMNNYCKAVLACENNQLLKLNDAKFDNVSELRVRKVEEYGDWFRYIGGDTSVAQLCYMLTKYCERLDSYDTDLVYVKLSKNGNPVKKLLELGYNA